MVTCLFYFLPNTIIAHTDQLTIWILIAHAHIYVWIEHSVWQYDSARVVTKIIRRFNVSIECVGWGHHSSLNFLILLFTKPNMEVSGWLYQTKTHITHIVYQPFSIVTHPNYIALRVTKLNGRTSYRIYHWIIERTSCIIWSESKIIYNRGEEIIKESIIEGFV